MKRLESFHHKERINVEKINTLTQNNILICTSFDFVDQLRINTKIKTSNIVLYILDIGCSIFIEAS